MADTLDALLAHLDGQVDRAKVVVWAHNSHVGDARATELGSAGELNLGQLARERHEDETLSVGLTTFRGTVTAARDWGEPAERRRVRPGLPGSYEELLHDTGIPRLLIDLQDEDVAEVLHPERLAARHRGDLPARVGTAQPLLLAHLAEQFDALIHCDETRALDRWSPYGVGAGRAAGDVSHRALSGSSRRASCATVFGRGTANPASEQAQPTSFSPTACHPITCNRALNLPWSRVLGSR
jgi:hypothetical protein